MEYEEILYDLEFANIVKPENCQLWQEKGFELCWRLMNGIDYIINGMAAELYFGDGWFKYSLKDLNGDGIPEIIVAGNIYGFNGSEYVRVGYGDYGYQYFNENTGKCTMVYGVSVTDDYVVGYFKGTEFVPEFEFGKVYGDYDGYGDTYWQRIDGMEETIDQYRFEELMTQYANNEENKRLPPVFPV